MRPRTPAERRTDPDAWDEIWSSLCHQGTTYSATYAALPHIIKIADALPTQEQLMYVVFAAAVAGRYSGPDELRGDCEAALARARSMALALLLHGSFGRHDRAYLLASLARLDGHIAIGDAIEGACVDQEIAGECPECGGQVYLTPEEGGLQVRGTLP